MLGDVTLGVLDTEVYSEAEAARLLRLPPSTLSYWLNGGKRRNTVYEPIVRDVPRPGHPPVTWAEFVECSWLRQYRRQDKVPMAELRAFITIMRREYGVPYPLAHWQPFANQRQLVVVHEAQQDADLPAEFALVAETSGQLVLTAPSQEFVDRLDFEDGIAVAWRPHADERSPVRVRPDGRFGRPAIAGISTDVLWEQVNAGASAAEVAEDYDLTEDEVNWAVSYEAAPAA